LPIPNFAKLQLGVPVSASAEPILRLVTFRVADPGKQDQAFQVVSDVNKLFIATYTRGLRRLASFSTTETGEREEERDAHKRQLKMKDQLERKIQRIQRTEA
jgi:hypothetical protein